MMKANDRPGLSLSGIVIRLDGKRLIDLSATVLPGEVLR